MPRSDPELHQSRIPFLSPENLLSCEFDFRFRSILFHNDVVIGYTGEALAFTGINSTSISGIEDFGCSVANMGDINGDQTSDVAVGR